MKKLILVKKVPVPFFIDVGGKALKIIARPIGAIQGAQEYYNNKNKQEKQ